jgi:hypothetical protein
VKGLNVLDSSSFPFQVVQLEELLQVRHSVFIVGNAGTGKTKVWRTLYKTYKNQKRKPVFNDLNPKAVTTNELFGIINPTTREWKDGRFGQNELLPFRSQSVITIIEAFLLLLMIINTVFVML